LNGLAGARILVTGAEGGIGAAVLARLTNAGGVATGTDLTGAHPCDLRDRAAVEALLDSVGPLDGLVHCAARCGGAGPFHTVSAADWQSYIDINLTGSFHVCQAVAQRMIAAGTQGRIVMIGSVNAIAAEAEASPYVASKGGVRMLVKAMAVDLAPFGIAANLVHPGPITVARNAEVFADPALIATFARLVPMGHSGDPADVARAACFLVDPALGFVTGAELAVDGGLLAQILAAPR
jgi:NAD(P)-dependent dehydrogenase (short-subunit alcohol dehydrogenase family)